MSGDSIAGLLAQYVEILGRLDRTTDQSERRALIAEARILTCEFNDLRRTLKDMWTARLGERLLRKPVKKGLAELDRLVRDSTFDFICTELDLGITFCRVASTLLWAKKFYRMGEPLLG